MIHLDHSFLEIRAWFWNLSCKSVTPYTWSENYQADIAMRQLEDCGVPCECPRCVSAYYRLQRIQYEKEQRDLLRPSREYVLYD